MQVQRVVLVGAQAQGKSTFFNKITNQNENTSYSGPSCTRQIVQGTTIYEQGFEVIDTPGFDSEEDKLLHISGIIAALTYGTVNRVLIFTKYERNVSINKNLELVFRPIHRYKSIVTVIFTHWDLCVNGSQEMEKKRIKELISKQLNLDSLLFFSKQDEPKYICKEIERILFSENQGETIQLQDSEIYKNFDIIELDCDNSNKLSDHAKRSQFFSNKFIQSLQTTYPHFQLILHEITQKITEEAIIMVIMVEEFEKKKWRGDIANGRYAREQFAKEIRKEVEYVIQTATKRMKETKLHFFNFQKRCPHCKQIWFKVVGCDGETICGQRVNAPQKKIQLVRNDKNELQCFVNERADQNPRLQVLKQISNFVQENKSLKQKVLDSNKLEKVLIKLFGDQYPEILTEKFINGDIDEFSLIKTIESHIESDNSPFSLFRSLFESSSYSEIQEKQEKQKGVGCEELDQLFSTELLEYFADSQKIEKEETDWLNKTYKEIVDQAIVNEKAKIKILEKKSLNQKQQVIQ